MAEQRRQLLRRELAGTIASGLSAPRTLVEAANRYQNEQRSIEYVLLDRALAGEIPPPPPEVLAKYFEERKILFRTPEYRKLVIVSLIPSEQARWIEISDADLKRAYEERRARYVTPERRHILQIDFPNAEAASAAAERIAKGASFTEIAKELGKSEKDIDLGTVPKSAMIDRAVADAAFALKEGEVSAPVQGRFGTVLVQVAQDRTGAGSLPRASGRRAQAGAGHRARQVRDFRPLQQDRGRARRGKIAGRGRRQSEAGGAHGRSGRSLRPRCRRHAGEASRCAAASPRGI